MDGTCLRRAWGGACENAAATAAIGVDDDGCREAIGAAKGLAGSSERWRGLLSRPKSRGLRGVRTFAGDKAAGMVGTFPDGKSALMLATARLKCVAEGEWGSRRYLDVTLLDERPHRMAGL